MSELYLIAHKVSGEPAFDVAERMTCPECDGDRYLSNGIIDITGDDGMVPCAECDGLGYWWIIPTSGHRAHPYWQLPLDLNEGRLIMDHNPDKLTWTIFDMPPSLPDHYRHGPAPKVNIKALFKKSDWVPNPEAFIKRRL